jgi:spore maturation protein A
MNKVFIFFIVSGIVVSLFNNTYAQVLSGIADSCMQTAELLITFGAVWSFWLGIMKIAEKTGIIRKIAHAVMPLIKILFPVAKKNLKAMEYILLNISANLFGLGNASAPFGIAAMKELNKMQINSKDEKVMDDMIMFVVINTTSLQLIPLSVISLRAVYGSSNPAEIIVPTLLATSVTTLCGIVLVKVVQFWRKIKCPK